MKVCCVFSVEWPHRGDSNKYTQYTTFDITKEITQNYPKSAAMEFFSKRLKNEFEKVVVDQPSMSADGLLYMAISNVLLSFLTVVFVYSFSCNWFKHIYSF